uniref:KxDL motif-containing protein 1 n=2 Tax=Anas platyrhynchos TaxID=8839 RepID=A0A493TVM9_ANAPP
MEPTASRVFCGRVLGMVNAEDVNAIILAQKNMLDRFEKTNEMLLNFNNLSSLRMQQMSERFAHHTRTLVEMKKDLDSIFRRIRHPRIPHSGRRRRLRPRSQKHHHHHRYLGAEHGVLRHQPRHHLPHHEPGVRGSLARPLRFPGRERTESNRRGHCQRPGLGARPRGAPRTIPLFIFPCSCGR